MTTTSEKILKTIKEAKVKPQPKWKFLVKNWSFWIMFGISLLVGALSFSVMLDLIIFHDWDIYFYLHKTFLQYVLLSLPYVWIILLIIFLGVAYFHFTHIKGWYRHRVYLVVSASVFLSFVCGIIFFFAGLGKTIDRIMTRNLPIYGRVKINKENLWNHPEEGLLSGKIIRLEDENKFILEDFFGKKWSVRDSGIGLSGRNIGIYEEVEMIGFREDSDRFVARNIREADTEREGEFIRKKNRPISKNNNMNLQEKDVKRD
ncbi:MAG: hypothetical protein HGA61_02360 [Candidatus Moranbacteria bacterium]|nr:hypothetical protein [Candidatus Moranbacteria bacterium]